MPRTITVFSGSPRDFCEGGMHNGAQQCFHCWSKLRSHKHETNNTKASTTHGILIEGYFILDHNSKEWDSGGPHISHIYHISHILHTTKIEGTTHTKQLVNGLIFRRKSEKTLEDCPKKVYFWGEAHSVHSLYVQLYIASSPRGRICPFQLLPVALPRALHTYKHSLSTMIAHKDSIQ